MLKKVVACLRRAMCLWDSQIAAMRLFRLRLGNDLQVGRGAHLASTAKFDFTSDGWHLHGTVRVGVGLRLSHGALISPYGGTIAIGDNVYIGPYTIIYGHGGVSIGDNVLIAGHAMIVAANHEFGCVDRPISQQGISTKGIIISEDVWIGSGVCVLDGVNIGKGVVVAAGAVITKSIPPFAVVAGVPARVVRYRNRLKN